MEDNRYGFHGRHRQGHDHNANAQGAGKKVGGTGGKEPGGMAKKHMEAPSNHAGHTYEMARRHEHDRRVEATRGLHTGKQMHGHERILHETHKLHQHDGHISHGTKHGEAHHVREESEGHIRETGKELD